MTTIFFVSPSLNSQITIKNENKNEIINALLATGHVITSVVEA